MPSDKDPGAAGPAKRRPAPWSGLRGRPGAPSRTRIAVAAAALAAFAGFTWYAYDRATRPGGEAMAPLIRAEKGPTRVRPETPGGMEVPHQDKLVYERLAQGESKPEDERLMPAPETPKIPRFPAPAAGGEPTPDKGPDKGKVEVLIGPIPPPEPPITVEEGPLAAAEPPSEAALAPAAGPPAPAETPGEAPQAASAAPPAGPPAEKGEGAGAAEQAAHGEAKAPAQPAGEKAPAKPKTVAAVPAPAAEPGPSGSYRVQVGAFRSREAAEREWARLRQKNADLLGPLTLTIEQADLGAKGVFYRVQGGPLTKQAAAKLCAEFKRRKAGCFVVKR